jgi:putative ABC transport system permease protein
MKYWTIVSAALTRKKVRTFMTIASIATAFLLFSLGRSVAVAFTSEVDYAGKDRLIVSSKLSFTQAMPMSYANKIEALEGVEKVAWRQWFGGTYVDRANYFAKWPVPESYFDIFPEFVISE